MENKFAKFLPKPPEFLIKNDFRILFVRLNKKDLSIEDQL